MKTVSIKRLVLTLILGIGSVMTLPAYAWPDTDEMNMCGAAVKKMRAYAGDHRGWASHDNYINHLSAQYYYLANCPQSKATKNYKGSYWTAGAKMPAKKKAVKKHVKRIHSKKYGKKADCVAVDRMNTTGPAVRRVNHSSYSTHDSFYRDALAVLNMGKAKKYKSITKKVNGDYCVVTNGLNTSGAAVRVVRRR